MILQVKSWQTKGYFLTYTDGNGVNPIIKQKAFKSTSDAFLISNNHFKTDQQ